VHRRYNKDLRNPVHSRHQEPISMSSDLLVSTNSTVIGIVHAPETLPPVDPRRLLPEPRVNRTRGRPTELSTDLQHKSCHQAHHQRDPSSFEYVLEEGPRPVATGSRTGSWIDY